MEIIFFSIYLENINWENIQLELEENLMLTALYVKVNLSFIIPLSLLFLKINYFSN